ncbi:LLM class flavin-dependent oxidoreductase [Siccirubricoccus deserti]
MKLGITLGMNAGIDMELVLEAERLGFDSVWCGEAYGSDAVSPVAWVLARTTRIKAGTGILQMPARTPTCAAMTAMTLQSLSGDRFLCGIGPSGPQVVEGWHGTAYGKPIERTREYISIIKTIIAREAPLVHKGEHYSIPYDGPDATGLGKPLKSIIHGKPMKFYTASITPGGMRLSGEIADGNLPIFMSPEGAGAVLKPTLEGRAKAGRPADLGDYDIAPYTKIRVGPDVQACRDAVKPELALYIGGMGARGRISTTTASGLATRMRRWRSRTSTSPARRRRRRRRCRMRWWTRSHWSVPPTVSAAGCRIGRRWRRRARSARWC